MNIKKFLKEIPKLPLSALIFFIVVFILWNLGVIPPPVQVVEFLENLYNKYGLIGLSIATFLEGIVYLGLYFPGSFIIALAVFFSDGSLLSLFSISLVVAVTLTITSFINYFLGRHVLFRNQYNHLIKDNRNISKGFLLSMLHPNLIAFYFFNAGIERRNPWKIALVPIIMIPYGFLFAWILSTFKLVLRSKLENPWTMLILISIWLITAFIIEHLSKKRRNKIYQEFE
ncbi:hypothetical protein J4221_05595 [Candidatus Pacearchaeota archaeon]|nr:hypothetical protein [Candidatus Pacearchaeota archaeon]